MRWRVMPGFSDYEVSDTGLARRIGSDTTLKVQRTKGYAHVGLKGDNGRRALVRLNRMVLLAFVGEPPTLKHHAAHQNGNQYDDRVENLKWMTAAENCAQKIEHGTQQTCERNSHAALSNGDVTFIREHYVGRHKTFGLRPLCKKFGVSHFAVTRALYGDTFKELPGARQKPGKGAVSRPAAISSILNESAGAT